MSDGAGGRPRTVLARVQRALEELYRVTAAGDVTDFVVGDEVRELFKVGRAPREQLLFVHDVARDDLSIGLYVDELALRRLARAEPPPQGPAGAAPGEDAPSDFRVDERHLEEYLLAVEGVSHFLYVMTRASAGRPFSALELELQAEVDKYLLVLLGSWRHGGEPPRDLRERLFFDVRFHDDLDPEERDRYVTANAAASDYAATLEERYVRRRAVEDMLGEVRRFYRLSCAAKLAHIARKAA